MSLILHRIALLRPTLGVAAPSLPDAFSAGDWSIAPGDEDADVTINALPAHNGSAITDIEYRLDGGSWASSGGTTSFTITGLTNDQEYDVELRAVNGVGAGAASDVKQVTPQSDDEPAWSPLDLGAKLKAWWDYNDSARLWTDTSGTTPADVSEAVARVDDKTGNGHHGVQVTSGNRPIRDVSGGCLFDGANDRFEVPDHADLRPTSQITIYTWVYPAAAGALFAKEGPGSTGYGTWGGTPNLYIRAAGAWRDDGGATGGLSTDQWQSYALTFDGSNVRGWKNHVNTWTTAASGSIEQGAVDLQLGFGPSSGFAGRLGTQLICDQALSEEELTLLDGYFAAEYA